MPTKVWYHSGYSMSLTLDEELTQIGAALTRIVQQLRTEGYLFQAEPLRPPTDGFAIKLSQLEHARPLA